MASNSKSRRTTKGKKQRKDYYKGLLIAFIKPFICLILIIAFVVCLFQQYTTTNYVGKATELCEVTGTCTNIQIKEKHEIGKGSHRYNVIIISIDDNDYTLSKDATNRITKNQNIEEFNAFVEECLNKKLTVQYPVNSDKVAALFTPDRKTVYVSLQQTEQEHHLSYMFFVCFFSLLFILAIVASCVFFMANKPERPYFMQKEKDEKLNR